MKQGDPLSATEVSDLEYLIPFLGLLHEHSAKYNEMQSVIGRRLRSKRPKFGKEV